MVLDLLQTLKTRGIKLWMKEDRLRFHAPKGAMTHDLKTSLLTFKKEIIAFLHEAAQTVSENDHLIEKADRTQSLPLSFSQQRLWLLNKIEGPNAIYNISCALQLKGALHIDVLERSFGEIIRRHEVLRTTFCEIDGKPYQTIAPPAPFHLALYEGQLDSYAEQASRLAAQPFDLASESLIRGQLIELGHEKHILVISMHHIISDGWSLGILVRELTKLFAAYSEGKPSPLGDLALQYADYAAWQQHQNDAYFDPHRRHWRSRFQDMPGPLELPSDHPRPPVQTYNGQRIDFAIPKPLLSQLEQFSHDHDVTLFMTLRTALAVLLSRLCGRTDIAIGSPIAGRSHAQLESLIGFFVNTVVFRCQWRSGTKFTDLLAMVRKQDPVDLSYGEMPFDQVLEACNTPRDQSHTPLFQVMFVLQNSSIPAIHLPGLETAQLPLQNDTAKFDLVLAIGENGTAQLEYNTDLFESPTAHAFINMYLHLLRHLEQPVPVEHLPILPLESIQQLRDGWNQTKTAYPREVTLGELVQAQVKRDPKANAYEWPLKNGEIRQLSYHHLNGKANSLARRLAKRGIQCGSVVGLYTRPGPEMVVAILAIVKLGATYLPLDPAYSPKRLLGMIEDSAAELVLIGKSLNLDNDIPTQKLAPIALMAMDEKDLTQSFSPDVPASIIFTSGSAGTPKGCVIPQRAVTRLVCHTNYVQFEPLCRVGRVSNISFDAATFEIWGALLNGGTMVEPPPKTLLTPQKFSNWIETQRPEHMFLTVAVFNQTIKAIPNAFASLKTLLVGGEALDPISIKRCLVGGAPAMLGNGYGPTENTTFSVCGALDDVPPGSVSVPIGYPIANSTAFIVDPHLALSPLGVIGELLVGGDGLASGYLNRPSLTSEKFVPNPFTHAPGDRLFRTGDLARRDRDGKIWYLGRVDHQIKLREFRIELSKIETHLNQERHLSQAIVLVQGKARHRRLVAFARCDEAQNRDEIQATALASLRRNFPEHMIPTPIVLLDELPLTANGKVDRQALIAMPLSGEMVRTASYVTPKRGLETQVAKCFSEILEVSPIGAHDDFFLLGGHSLLASMLTARLRQALVIEVPLKVIFSNPTVAQLAVAIASPDLAGTKDAVIPTHDPNQPIPLSFSQERLWFLDRLEPGQTAYNIPATMLLTGQLDVARLHRAILSLCHRHESFRTTFREADTGIVQLIHTDLPPEWRLLAAENLNRDERTELLTGEMARSFDLEQGPLLRFLLLAHDECNHTLFVNLHHIIFDGWSMAILIRELAAIYGEPDMALPPTPVTYADYASWQRNWLQGEVLDQQQKFWTAYLSGMPTQLELPFDRPRPAMQSYLGSLEPITLDQAALDDLEQFASEMGATLFMALHTVFAILLSRHAHQDNLCIGTPMANRGRPEFESIIGLFVNSVVLRSDLSGDPSFREMLLRQRDSDLEAFDHAELPFEQVVELVRTVRTTSHSPLFQVMFSMQTEPVADLALDKLQIQIAEQAVVTAKFDLTLSLDGRGKTGTVEFNTDLFDVATIRQLIVRFKLLLSQVAANPDQAISSYPLYPPAQIAELLSLSSGPEPSPSDSSLVHQFLEHMAKCLPDSTALLLPQMHQDQAAKLGLAKQGDAWIVRYGQLNRFANRVAHHLIALGAGPETRIGLCLPPSFHLYVAVFAVLKAGATYVALDPNLPPARMDLLVEDSGLNQILTEPDTDAIFPKHISLCMVAETLFASQMDHNPLLNLDPQTSAYMVYTSGSTGRPKGVLVPHQSLVAHAVAISDAYDLSRHDSVLQFSAFSFDVFAEEVFSTLRQGAQLVIPTPEIRTSLHQFAQFLQQYSISVLNLPAAFWHEWVDEVATLGCFKAGALRLVITGSDKVYGEKLALWHKHTAVPLVSAYGTTETTITNTLNIPKRGVPHQRTLPIGRPIAGQRTLVVDDQLKPLPTGIPGELVIGGTSLARGYHKQPGLTATRFIPDPFSSQPGARLYRSGDLVRLLRGGDLLFVGRLNAQVKLRGFRIELGEIESLLRQHDTIVEAVVLVKKDHRQQSRLVGFVKPAAGSVEPDINQWRTYLADRLPAYMVPATLVVLPRLPLTPNGKLDRQALTATDVAITAPEQPYQAPQSVIESMLATLFGELLGIPKVSIHDHFFEMGGHSLLATRLTAAIRHRFAVNLPLATLFAKPTLIDLAVEIERLQAEESQSSAPPLVPVSRDRQLPLSFAQQRLWVLDQLEPDNPAYNMYAVVHVRGELNLEALQLALDALIARHESLRTQFLINQAGQPYQVILNEAQLVIQHQAIAPNSSLEKAATQEALRPFRLQQAPLVRVTLLAQENHDRIMVLNMHHIISDGWSIALFLDELSNNYQTSLLGNPPESRELPIQYADFSVWQRQWLSGGELERQLSYWQIQLGGAPNLLELPLDRPRPGVQTTNGETIAIMLDAKTTQALQTIANTKEATLFVVLQAIFANLLGRYARTEDLVIGSPVANRRHSELEQVIGLFLNTIAIRFDLSGDPDLNTLIDRTRKTVLDGLSHQDAPFEKVIEAIQPNRDLSYSPIFQVMLAFQNMPEPKPLSQELILEPISLKKVAAKFDMTLFLSEEKDCLKGVIEYNCDLFDEATIARLWDHFCHLAQQAVAAPDIPLSQFSLPLKPERDQLLKRWNDTATNRQLDACFHEIFEEQARLFPKATAVTFAQTRMDFFTVNREANRLAHYLRAQGVVPDMPVALLMHRNCEMVIGLLAILKAGGAYVPLDPTYPTARLAVMLEGVSIVLTENALTERLPDTTLAVLTVESWQHTLADQPQHNPVNYTDPDNLVYIIYTSGSTGTPKGVAVTHRNMNHYLDWACDALQVTEGDGSPVHGSISFDATITALWLPLFAGRAAHMIADGEDLEGLTAMLQSGAAFSLIKITPPHLDALAQLVTQEVLQLPNLCVGGDVLIGDHLEFWHKASPDTLLMNEYGPTEATIGCCSFQAPIRALVGGAIPIGYPLADTQLHVREPGGLLAPIGVPGEMYIGGWGLARGYIGQPGLTADRFVPNPFSTQPGSRLYRTGDLVRRRRDGALFFVARIDHQIKIRGFRIELGEIEAQLASLEGIAETSVLTKKDRLLAFYTLSNPELEISNETLLAQLSQHLPHYMMPNGLTKLDHLPLTPNGKVDRRALAAIEVPTPHGEGIYQAPRNQLESCIAGLYGELLEIPRVGIQSHFFKLGGHSLLATQLVSRLRQVLQMKVPLKVIFANPVVADLAEAIASQELVASATSVIPLRDPDQPIPLSYSQERLWFLDSLEPGQTAYSMPATMALNGQLNIECLHKAVLALCERHQNLRTTFCDSPSGIHQIIHDQLDPEWRVFDANTQEATDLETLLNVELARPFDLAAGPLLRFHLIVNGPLQHTLFVNMHHIIADGWSFDVLIRELITLYAAIRNGEPSPFAPLQRQYADYAAWQRQEGSESFEQAKSHWRQRLANAPGSLELPTDHPRPAEQTYQGAHVHFTVPSPLFTQIKQISEQNGTTLFTTLRTAFAVLLSRLSGQTDICIGSPVSGRSHLQLEPLIGFFVNTVVFRNQWHHGVTFVDLLAMARRNDPADLDHSDLPLDQVLDSCGISRDQSHSPLFQVMFVFQNIKQPSLTVPDLVVSSIPLENSTAKFDLLLVVSPSGDGQLEYNSDLFHASTANNFVAMFLHLLAHLDAPGPVHQLPLMDEPTLVKMRDYWNQTQTIYPRESTLGELFETQVKLLPLANAYEWTDSDGGVHLLNYQDLNNLANAMAKTLATRGVVAGDVVSLYAYPCASMLAAMIAIVKLGATYLPLDPDNPESRLRLMIEDSGAKVLLIGDDLDLINPGPTCQMALKHDDAQAIDNPPHAVSPELPAYIVYTSGATGTPHGIVIPQRAVVRLVRNTNYVQLDASCRIGRVANMAFDAATFEIWGALLNGGCIVEAPKNTLIEPKKLGNWIRSHQVDTMFLTVAIFNQTVQASPDAFATMKTLLVGGEALEPVAVRRCLNAKPPAVLGNGYGPTENTTFSICGAIADLPQGSTSVPLGGPIANSTAYILDRHFEICPMGVVGELLVGGDGLAHGYHNQPGLTGEKFIPNPFATNPGDRLYRTGDLARRSVDGTIWCRGRIGHQIKLRGFRIELGEIESQLNEQADISQAVVVIRGTGEDRRLVGFARYNGDADQGEVAEQVLDNLRHSLPAYMIPTPLVLLKTMPLTPNGKVDRLALSAIEITPTKTTKAFELPRNPLERCLVDLYAELLDLKEVSIHDNFFDLGGHSLLATRLTANLREALIVEVPLKLVFANPVLSNLAQAIASQNLAPAKAATIPVRNSELPVPLSFSQERLWFLDRLDQGQTVYSVPIVLELSGWLDIAGLHQAALALCQRHESLRTTFAETGTGPIQVIHTHLEPEWRIVQADTIEKRAQENLLSQEIARPFNLEKGPLLRFLLIAGAQNQYTLCVNMHHIVTDGWSLSILVQELTTLYQASIQGKPSPLAELALQFPDYATWQRQLGKNHFDRSKQYWQTRLAHAPEPLELPTDHLRPPIQTFHGGVIDFNIAQPLLAALEAYGQQRGLTLFMTLRSALAVLLSRLCGTNDICIGAPVAARTHAQLAPLIGFFVNTVAFRTQWQNGATFADILEAVRENDLLDLSHSELPFDQVLETCEVSRDQSHSPLFQIMFVFQNNTMPTLDLTGLEVTSAASPSATAKFDLTLSVSQSGSAQLEYNSDLFEANTARNFATMYQFLLSQLESQTPVHRLPLMDEPTYERVCHFWNQTRTPYPRKKTMGELFEALALTQPSTMAYEWTAADGATHHWDYGQLNARANGLSQVLLEQGVGAGDVVGLYTHPSAQMLAAMMAIIKLGAAYMPLDPAYPNDRLQHMVDDSGLKVLLVGEGLSTTTTKARCHLYLPDLTNSDESNPKPTFSSQLPAYIIYTSGSTGLPKGTVIPQRAVVRLVRNTNYVRFQPSDRVARDSSISFDVATYEIWGALLNGGTIVEPPRETLLNPQLMGAWTQNRRIDHMFLTPVLFNQTVQTVPFAFGRLKTLLVGGEALDPVAVRRCLETRPPARFGNGYGPTENTSFSICGAVEHLPPGIASVPLGCPISNSTAYIADSHLELSPIGVSGELVVGGDGLALGYLNRPKLTSEKFVPNPFSGQAGDRLYRTGDLSRRTEDGTIWYLGRLDHQIKLRGHRIELGEIETALLSHEAIREAVVLPHGTPPKFLIAYLIAQSEASASNLVADQLRPFLRSNLPDYMVPAVYTVIAKMPMTPNGKLNRKALPKPDLERLGQDQQEQLPQTPQETIVAEVWQEVLGLQRISVHQSFFDLGGHSLLATQVITRLRERTGIALELRQMFEAPTIAQMAKAMAMAEKVGESAALPILAQPRGNPFPLSYTQQRLWFLAQLDGPQAAYYLSTALKIEGPFNPTVMELALTDLVARH